MKKVIVFGNNIIAKMLFEDSKKLGNDFLIEAFCVDDEYLTDNEKSFCGLNLIGFSSLKKLYHYSEYDMISTVDAPSKLRNRLLVFNRLKDLGYTLRNYISPMSDISETIEIGENNLIMAFAHVGYGGKLKNANFIRQNVYLGHDFRIGSGNTISAGCSLAGYCNIGDSCFIGIGASILEHTNIANETLIGCGTVVVKDTEGGTTYVGNPAKPISTHKETGIMMNVRRY